VGRLTGNGQFTSVTAPTQVAPGDYIVLNEVIALQLDVTIGVEFYPSCTQSRGGGSQTGKLIQAFSLRPTNGPSPSSFATSFIILGRSPLTYYLCTYNLLYNPYI
jgi:hypothetical protein